MRPGLFLALMLALVPLQATAMQAIGVMGVRPDVCLIAAFLVGFFTGELEGLLMGLAIGFVQDLFSAGPLWLNVITKGLLGLLAGMLGRHLANATTVSVFSMMFVLSIVAGAVFAFSLAGEESMNDTWQVIQSKTVPEAIFNAALGSLLYWCLPGRRQREDAFSEEIRIFGR